MKVAVALADKTLLAALIKQRAQALDTGLGPLFERVQLAQIRRFAE